MKTRHVILAYMVFLSAQATGQTSKVIVTLDSISQVTLTKVIFVAKDHKIEYSSDAKYPITIDNRPVFGTDGEMPKTQLTSAVLTIGAKKFNLDVSGMFDPWNGDALVNQRVELKWGWRGSRKVLRANLSDGAGAYVAEWTIIGSASVRTILSDNEWIMIEYFGK